MKRHKSFVPFATMAGLFLANSTVFAAGEKMCVPEGYGVPGRYGAPKWVAWDADVTTPVNPFVDDPRWNGAHGVAFGAGAAGAPAEFRVLYGTTGTQQYLYLSWVINIGDAISGDNRQLYVGFKPPTGPAKIIRFRFPTVATGEDHPTGFTKCNAKDLSAGCAGTVASGTNNPFYAVYTASAAASFCAETGAVSNSEFLMDTSATSNVKWIEDTDPTKSAARFWVKDATHTMVQLRIPINAAATAFEDGIQDGTKIWYEVPVNTTGVAALYAFPRTAVGVHRYEGSTPLKLCHGESVAGAKFEDSFADIAKLSYGVTTPGCGGVSLAYDDVGFVHDVPFNAATYDAATLSSQITGVKPDLVTQVTNTLIVRPYNGTADSGAAVNINPGEITARMRIANWGTEGIDYNDTSTAWHELTGGHAVGLDNTSAVIPGQKALLHLDWKLSPTERCDYGIDPTSSTNWPTIADPAGCTRKYSGGDQCILVNLSGNGAFEFANTSLYRNMTFGEMSLFEKPAIIDTASLPAKKGQKYQDIYLFFSPRNLPSQLPAGTNGTDLIADNATKLRDQLTNAFGVEDPNQGETFVGRARSFVEGNDQTVTPGDSGIYKFVMRRPLSPELDRLLPQEGDLPNAIYSLPYELQLSYATLDRIARLPRGERANKALTPERLTMELNGIYPPSVLDSLVPSVDVYTFYDTFEKLQDGTKKVDRLEPMSSFSFHGFLEPGEIISKLKFAVGNAHQISDNVFRIRIKTGDKSAVNFQIQALEDGEDEICNDENWGSKGCSGGGGFTFVGLGAVFAIGPFRRRRKRS